MSAPDTCLAPLPGALERFPLGDGGTPHPLFAGVLRLTAPNPGPMTGPGTNSYLYGTVEHGFFVVDPGPADELHLQRLWQAARHPDGSGGNVRAIVCTHSHPDHSPGAAPLQALCARSGHTTPPILGLPSAPTARPASAFVPDQPLAHASWLTLPAGEPASATATACADRPAGPLRLLAIHTPGHAANHVCLLSPEQRVLFTGDHILQGSTTVIDPPDGNMHAYLQALDTLADACRQYQVDYLLPAHGKVMAQPLEVIAQLKAHRLRREAKVEAAMLALPDAGPDSWVRLAYDDVDARLWPLALRSLLAHVERIRLLRSRTPVTATPAAP